MARIRTIKPEFPQSESMGRVSRDARLLFVLLWTIADDVGRARAASRMLASLLFPYDDDAPNLIGGWLDELECEGCIKRYEADGSTYLEIAKWLNHQRIDKPSASRLPQFREGSRALKDTSHTDLGPWTLDLGPSIKERKKEARSAKNADAPANLVLIPEIEVAFEIYNRTAEACNWPKAARITDSRSKHFKARFAECGGIDGWRSAMAKAQASPFLTGRDKKNGNGHDSWRPDLDFFLQQSSFTKLMEGKYDGDGQPRNLSETITKLISEGLADPFGSPRGPING